jgi:predicted MFS family arabinose efflux permease
MRGVLERPAVRSLVARHGLFIFAVTYFFTIFALFVQRMFNGGPQLPSWLIAGCGAVGGITLVVAVGPLAKRYGDAKVAQAGIALSILAYAGLGFAHELWSYCAVLAVWSAGASCVEPTLSALLSKRAPELGGFIIDRDIGLIGVVPGAALIVAFALGSFDRTSG